MRCKLQNLEDAGDDVGLHPPGVLRPSISKLLPVPLVNLKTPDKREVGQILNRWKETYLRISMSVVTTGR